MVCQPENEIFDYVRTSYCGAGRPSLNSDQGSHAPQSSTTVFRHGLNEAHGTYPILEKFSECEISGRMQWNHETCGGNKMFFYSSIGDHNVLIQI